MKPLALEGTYPLRVLEKPTRRPEPLRVDSHSSKPLVCLWKRPLCDCRKGIRPELTARERSHSEKGIAIASSLNSCEARLSHL